MTKISILQFFDLLNFNVINNLMDKYDFCFYNENGELLPINQVSREDIRKAILLPENNELIKPLLDEIISTQTYLKNNVTAGDYSNNDSMFEERLKDLEKCLLRDGFEVKEGVINPVEEQLDNSES